MIAAAAACPTATPAVLAGPLGMDISAAAYNAFASAIPLATHAGDSGNCAITDTSTSRAAAATGASRDAGPLACALYAYGRERRSMAFNASWTATCAIAYIRDSARPFPLICIHAAVAAFAAFSFHKVTASAVAALGQNTRSDTHTPKLLAICFFMEASHSDLQRLNATFFTGVSAVRRPELQRVAASSWRVFRPGVGSGRRTSVNGPVDGSGQSRLVDLDNLDNEKSFSV